jgi:O-antigen/teichoic acid export membrane protein
MRAQSGKTVRRIVQNASALSLAEGLSQLANFAFVISFARSFGATQMAYYSVAMAAGAIAALFMTVGTQNLLVKEFSRDPTRVPVWLGVLLPAGPAGAAGVAGGNGNHGPVGR